MKQRLLTAMLSVYLGVLVTGLSCPAAAQDLVYTPVNPSFGGNPFNSAHLLAIANAQNDFEPEVDEASSQDDLDRFISSLQSRLLSSLSTQVANAIFGEDAQDEGTIVFGDQTISFVRGLDGIELTITEADGSQTVITVPIFTSTATDSGTTTEGASTTSGSTTASDGLPVPSEPSTSTKPSVLSQPSLATLPRLGTRLDQSVTSPKPASSLLAPPPLLSGSSQSIQ